MHPLVIIASQWLTQRWTHQHKRLPWQPGLWHAGVWAMKRWRGGAGGQLHGDAHTHTHARPVAHAHLLGRGVVTKPEQWSLLWPPSPLLPHPSVCVQFFSVTHCHGGSHSALSKIILLGWEEMPPLYGGCVFVFLCVCVSFVQRHMCVCARLMSERIRVTGRLPAELSLHAALTCCHSKHLDPMSVYHRHSWSDWGACGISGNFI